MFAVVAAFWGFVGVSGGRSAWLCLDTARLAGDDIEGGVVGTSRGVPCEMFVATLGADSRGGGGGFA